MINLLPDTSKKQIIAARTNVLLFNYIIVLGIAVIFLVIVTVGVYVVLMDTKDRADAIIKENQAKTSSYNTVQAQAKTLQASLETAKSILDKEVVYSKIILGIANSMPEGVVIDTLSLNPGTLDTPTTLQIFATTNDAALELKKRFQQSALFSDVSFTLITTNTGSTASTYPVSATLRLTINKVNL